MAGKKGMKLRAWGTLRRLPSGKWQASYVGPDLARHVAPVTYSTRMDAEHWLASERRLMERDEWASPKTRSGQRKATSITLNDYADKWIEQRNVKPGSKIEYKRLKAGLITDTLGKAPLNSISPDTIRTWHARLGTGTPVRVSRAYGLLHAICGTAVKDGLIPVNPCMIERAMSAPRKREPVILSVSEIGNVADAIKPERLRALVLVAAWCGLRWGEAIELRRRDIDDTCEVVLVSRAASHRDGCRVDTTKSGKARVVVVPPHIRADLKHHLDVYVDKAPEALVFPGLRHSCHLRDSVFAEHFRAALKTIGREGVRIHDLRHFAGSQTARVGNLVETMGRLGHSTPKASLIYQAIVSGRDREVAAALSELATGAGMGQPTG